MKDKREREMKKKDGKRRVESRNIRIKSRKKNDTRPVGGRNDSEWTRRGEMPLHRRACSLLNGRQSTGLVSQWTAAVTTVNGFRTPKNTHTHTHTDAGRWGEAREQAAGGLGARKRRPIHSCDPVSLMVIYQPRCLLWCCRGLLWKFLVE